MITFCASPVLPNATVEIAPSAARPGLAAAGEDGERAADEDGGRHERPNGEGPDDRTEERRDEDRVHGDEGRRAAAQPLARGAADILLSELSLFFQDPLGRLEPPWQMEPGRGRVSTQRVVADGAAPLRCSPAAHRAAEMGDVPPDRRE